MQRLSPTKVRKPIEALTRIDWRLWKQKCSWEKAVDYWISKSQIHWIVLSILPRIFIKFLHYQARITTQNHVVRVVSSLCFCQWFMLCIDVSLQAVSFWERRCGITESKNNIGSRTLPNIPMHREAQGKDPSASFGRARLAGWFYCEVADFASNVPLKRPFGNLQ